MLLPKETTEEKYNAWLFRMRTKLADSVNDEASDMKTDIEPGWEIPTEATTKAHSQFQGSVRQFEHL